MVKSETDATDSGAVTTPAGSEVPQDDYGMLEFFIVLAKHKVLIVGFPFVAGILAAVVTLFLPNIYTATTKILPPQLTASTTSGMLGQLGVLAGAAGGALGMKNPSDVYVAMLKSRTVADSLIQRFDLDKRYEQTYRSGTRKTLDKNVSIASGKDGIIAIDVDDTSPQFAAELANAYVDELVRLTRVLAVTEASQRRLFFEQQFLQAKENLARAEATARRELARGGLVKVDEQGRAVVETAARLRAEMAVKEVQIGAMRAFAAGDNPDLRRARHELDAMRNELAKIEGETRTERAGNNVSAKGVENIRFLRDLKYHETIYELLAKQYELAKIDEAKESSVIQVLDKAVEPDRKSKPQRAKLVLVVGLVAGLLAVFVAFLLDSTEKAKRDPRAAARLRQLRHFFFGK